MNYEVIDAFTRSRITLLDHLEEQGYDVTPYRKFSPKEIAEMVKAGPANSFAPALQMNLKRREDAPEQDEGLPTECLVAYTLGRIKQKLDPTILSFIEPEEGEFNTQTTEIIIITLEPIAPNFHAAAAKAWMQHKARVRFFQAQTIINNPLKHVLVPKHERVPKAEEEELLKKMFVKKSQLPFIRFHEDPIARMIGLVPMDIVKIIRPSPTAGEYTMYRVCVA